MSINTCMISATVQNKIIMSSKSIKIIMNDATIAGTTTVTEFAGDWGDTDCNCSVTDTEPEFEGDWGDTDFNSSVTDTEPEFEGDWGDADFNGNESGPE